jgi:hypothetical protein
MRRTTIMADEYVLSHLEQVAERRGVTLGLVIREALAAYVAGGSRSRRAPGFIGKFHGPGNVAENDEAILLRELPGVVMDPTQLELGDAEAPGEHHEAP